MTRWLNPITVPCLGTLAFIDEIVGRDDIARVRIRTTRRNIRTNSSCLQPALLTASFATLRVAVLLASTASFGRLALQHELVPAITTSLQERDTSLCQALWR